MSFFFVLSGFVVTHAHQRTDFSSFAAKRTFWCGRFGKIYPIFFVLWAWDLVGALFTTCFSCCPLSLVCYLSQLFMLNVWLGCQLHILNCPSWYLAVLVWFWLLFPYVQPLIAPAFKRYAWAKMVLVNCMATGSVYLFNDYGYFTFSMLPPLRVWEFVIGCAAATTIDQRLHFAWPLSVAVVLTAYYILCFYIFTHQTEQCYNQVDMVCAFWEAQPLKEGTDPCITRWTGQYMNKTAVLWAVLIQWVGSSEHLDVPHRFSMWLETSTALRELSKFSLHLYLGHGPLSSIVRAVVGFTDFHHPWQLDILMLVVYFLCYLLFVYVQPALDWGMDKMRFHRPASRPIVPSTESVGSATEV
jgi:peptidoglycan/LPS O-acetylase OafA/YrhL